MTATFNLHRHVDHSGVSGSGCDVDGCSRPKRARGWCAAHYQRWKNTGDVQADLPFKGGRSCSADGCERKYATNGYCNMHAMRMRNHGSLELPEPTVYYGEDHPAWKGAAITYKPAHFRVVARRGSASRHLCWNCGGQAQDWAYNHADPHELTCEKTGRIYSADPEHYRPLCRKCHKRIDNAARRGDVGCVLEVMTA